MEYNIKDAFKELEILNEAEEFNLTSDWDVDKLHDILTCDIEDDIADIIDPGLAEDQPALVDGDVIVRCEVCGSNLFKHPEDLILDPETELYNVEEECAYCHQVGGFKKVGIFKACEDLGECEAEISEDPPLEEAAGKQPITEAKWTKDSILAAARRLLDKQPLESLEEDNADSHMSPADIKGVREREASRLNEDVKYTKDDIISAAKRIANKTDDLEEDVEDSPLWKDRLDKLTDKKAITEADEVDETELSVEEPAGEVEEAHVENNVDLDELQDESTLAYTYYNFIPEDLYNDVKSGVADISQISQSALDAILDKGDFTEDQKKYLLDERSSTINDKFNDFGDNWEDRVK